MTKIEFIGKALRVPFADRGRDFDGWDCYGVVYQYYKLVLNINLPLYLDYISTTELDRLSSIIHSNQTDWIQVERPIENDLVLFRIGGMPVHLGVIVNEREMLHSEKKIGTFVEPISGFVWNKRLEGFYRYGKC